MTACKQAYRNLKLQTSKPLYLVGTQKIKKCLSAETMNGLAGKSVPFLRNIKLSFTDHGHIRYHSGEEGALITFVYIQITPSHSSPSVFVQHFWRPGLLWLGGEQNRPAPKDDPCLIFFLGVDLVLLRGEGLVGIFFRKTPLPIWFAGWPPFGNTGGELAPSRQILESTLCNFSLSVWKSDFVACDQSAHPCSLAASPWDFSTYQMAGWVVTWFLFGYTARKNIWLLFHNDVLSESK